MRLRVDARGEAKKELGFVVVLVEKFGNHLDFAEVVDRGVADASFECELQFIALFVVAMQVAFCGVDSGFEGGPKLTFAGDVDGCAFLAGDLEDGKA